jgi:hypothetical protein
MITVEEQQLREQLAIDEITFAIPAQSFAIACAISAEEALPVVTEFALRLAYVCGNLSPMQLQEFFGFSSKETEAVIQTLLNERLVAWSEDRLELTGYALARFQDSSDNLPRFFKIQDWSAEVVFDLISFSPVERPSRLKRVRSQVELAARDFDKQSRTIQFAEQSFQQNFRQICTREKAEIYKISAIDAGERFSIPLPCAFHLDLNGTMSVRRNIDDASFGSRQEIVEAITDALADQERGDNESLRDFLQMFDDRLLGRYTSDNTFDLRRYVQEVHLTKTASYDDDRITPMLGALHLQRNTNVLIGCIQTALKHAAPLPRETSPGEVPETPTDGKVPQEHGRQDALWWAPQSALWARTRGARELQQKLDRLLAPQTSGASTQMSSVHVVVSGKHRAVRERLTIHREFPRLLGSSITLLNGNLELLIVPELLVCAMYHFHLAHQAIPIPIGFISSHPDHLRAAGALVSKRTRANPDSFLSAKQEDGPEIVRNLLDLVNRLAR